MRTPRSRTVAFWTLTLALGAPVQAGGVLLVSIPPGRAATTLLQWSEQTGIQILFDFTRLAAVRTRAVAGTYSPADALDMMLRDTGYTFQVLDRSTLVVLPGVRYCRPELSADIAPLPPCAPAAAPGGTL